MIRLSEHEDITARNPRYTGYDVESLLAVSQATSVNTNSKPSAKVQPFGVLRENDLMESSNSRSENGYPKGHPTPPPIYPSLGYPPFPSSIALANFHLYSLWHQTQLQAGLVNWPLISNPAFTHNTTPPRTQSQSCLSDANLNNASRSRTNIKHQTNEDTSHSLTSETSNSATESLLAASECHLAVLQDEDGDTPLHIAVVHKNERLIQKLIGLISFSKLTVNSPNQLSQTALHLAVITRQPQVVQQLMNAGADANAQDRNGQTPVHLSSTHGYIKCLEEILNSKSKTPKLNFEIKNFEGLTALHVAVQKKHLNIVDALINCGANVNAKDGKSGHTPLHHAIDQECCEVLQLLVAKRANINIPNFSGVTPVQNANSCRNDAISKILLSQEAATTTAAAIGATKPKPTATNAVSVIAMVTTKSKENERTEDLRRNLESSPPSKRSRSDGPK